MIAPAGNLALSHHDNLPFYKKGSLLTVIETPSWNRNYYKRDGRAERYTCLVSCEFNYPGTPDQGEFHQFLDVSFERYFTLLKTTDVGDLEDDY